MPKFENKLDGLDEFSDEFQRQLAMEELAGKNIGNPPIKIEHSKLEREGESMFQSKCPVCKEGYLLVRRNPSTLKIEKHDYCVLCGQEFEYIGDLP